MSRNMEEEGGKKNKEKSQKQSNEESKDGAEHESERQSENKSLPELLQAENTTKKKDMADAIEENMKAVEKSDK